MATECKYKAIGIIAKKLEENNLKYTVDVTGDFEMLEVRLNLAECLPYTVLFVSTDDDNDVAVRIIGLIHSISEQKRAAMVDVCNDLNSKYRYFCFYVSPAGDLDVRFDFPINCSDDCVGPIAVEVIARLVKIIKESCPFF